MPYIAQYALRVIDDAFLTTNGNACDQNKLADEGASLPHENIEYG